MENSWKKIESTAGQKLSKESSELLEHIADILAEKFVEAMKKNQREDKEKDP
jgi:hypothetical protein